VAVPPLREGEGDGFVFGSEALHRVIDAFKEGGMVLLAEDGDADASISLMLHPQGVNEKHVEFLAEQAKRLQLALEPEVYLRISSSIQTIILDNNNLERPAISVSVDGATRDSMNSTSVAKTIRELGAAISNGSELPTLRCPGAVPVCSGRDGGLLQRAGVTEAAIELARLAELPLAAVHATLHTSGVEALRSAAGRWGLPYASTADLVALSRRRSTIIERNAPPARMPTKFGVFTAHCYRSLVDGIEHIALVKSDMEQDPYKPFAKDRAALVRVHSECCTGDIFGSLRCDCGPQLEQALQRIDASGYGVLLYLRGQEGRGIGLGAKMHAYSLQERGRDTMDANTELGLPVDSREYGSGAQILSDLGIRDMRLMSNNPKKFVGLAGFGLRIVERVPSHVAPNPENIRYLRTKEDRMGHLLELDDALAATNGVDSPAQMQILGIEEEIADASRSADEANVSVGDSPSEQGDDWSPR